MLQQIKKILSVLICITVLSVFPKFQTIQNNTSNTFLLRGKITTLNKIPIPKAVVFMERVTPSEPKYLVEGITDKYGNYAISIPKGVYKVKVKGWAGRLPSAENENICSPKCEWYSNDAPRANIDLTKLSSQNLNFTLVKEGYFMSSYRRPLVELKYEVPFSFDSKDLPLNIMIRYSTKNESGLLTTYKSIKLPAKMDIYPLAAITYDNITIYAEIFIFDKEKGQIVTKGKTIVDDGLNEFEVNNVTIDITNDKPLFRFNNSPYAEI